jgi:branched-chain amino acid transport system ATP-binding protein
VTAATKFGIRAVGMSAGYHGAAVVSDIDLYVEQGEMVALLGANGAGKTTTVMALAGLAPVLSGETSVAGKNVGTSLFKLARSGLGLMTEQRCIFSSLTCRENLRLGRGTVDDALTHFPELEPHLEVKAGLLSGGEQQMLALGRILAGSPRVILADEVSLGLAPRVVQRLLRALRAAANSGTAVLFVEQHPSLALRIVDRAYVLRRGRIVLEGTRADLRERRDEVAAFYL